jgi:hypothetical protein
MREGKSMLPWRAKKTLGAVALDLDMIMCEGGNCSARVVRE